MLPRVCQCCGGRIAAADQGRGMLICKDCEQLTTDDSPMLSTLALEALAAGEATTEAKPAPARPAQNKPPKTKAPASA